MMLPTPDELSAPVVHKTQISEETEERNKTLTLELGNTETSSRKFPSPAEHYKLVIEDARALSDRRDAINTMFVNVVSLIAGGAGYVLITYPGNSAGLAVILAASIFGWRLCHVWDDEIGYYKYLLNFRYETLKQWEKSYAYPPLQQYYRSEDFLYDGPKKAPRWKVWSMFYKRKETAGDQTGGFESTALSDSMPKSMRGMAGNFVNLYTALPQAARVVFLVLALLQIIAFAWRIGSPYLLHLLGPWRLLLPIKL